MGPPKKTLRTKIKNVMIARRSLKNAKEKEELILEASNDLLRTRSQTVKILNSEVENDDSEIISISEKNTHPNTNELLRLEEKTIIDKENKLMKEKGARHIKYITEKNRLLPRVYPRIPSDVEMAAYEDIVLKSFDKREDKEELRELAINTEFDIDEINCLYPKGVELKCVSFSVVSRFTMESLTNKVGMDDVIYAMIQFSKKNFLDTLIFIDYEHYDHFGQYITDSSALEFIYSFYGLSKPI